MNHVTNVNIFLMLLISTIYRCLNWCNQRGICTSPQEGGYCICNMGFTGEDCSQSIMILYTIITFL